MLTLFIIHHLSYFPISSLYFLFISFTESVIREFIDDWKHVEVAQKL
jgi:hypothetical protein